LTASHPPALSLDSTLAESAGYWLEIRCACGAVSFQPCKLLAKRYAPDLHLNDVLARLRCQQCGSRPATVALVERPDTLAPGRDPAGWRIMLRA